MIKLVGDWKSNAVLMYLTVPINIVRPTGQKYVPINMDTLFSNIYILVLNTDILLLINFDIFFKNIDVLDILVLNIQYNCSL